MTLDEITEARDRLHAFVRATRGVGCTRSVSCECPFCDIDRLVTDARVNAALSLREGERALTIDRLRDQ